ncbi:hypothetical protein [Georgenia sp. AZ-5]|uniref:hypothetical protein n=1 Tax=Georgenia sp. AZ-5 TaxID=3367526 RepID=UPI0037549982
MASATRPRISRRGAHLMGVAAAASLMLSACAAEEPQADDGTANPSTSTSDEQTTDDADGAAGSGEAAGGEGDASGGASPATQIDWQYPEIGGYELDEETTEPGVIQLVDDANACLFQLTAVALPALAASDRESTEASLEESVNSLDDADENGRESFTVSGAAGDVQALQADVSASIGERPADVRILMRASAADQALVGIMHVCPAGVLEDDVWERFLEDVEVQGLTATDFAPPSD